MQSMQKTLILMQKNKNKRNKAEEGKFTLSSTRWNGGNRMIWDGICGGGGGTGTDNLLF